MTERKEIHERVLKAKSKKELAEAYNEWAKRYDIDLVDEMGYVAPVHAAGLFNKHLKESGKILDAGCGTGLVGECLHKMGFSDITGLDYSGDMLQQAEQKGIYTALLQGDLNDLHEIKDNKFDGVISVGTFTSGHVGPGALKELVRITKPGGVICFTVRDSAWLEDGYDGAIAAMVKDGMWKLLEEQDFDYIRSEGSLCRTCVYQVAI
jgi:predicted TPR repeat methyltransferase